MGTRTLSGLKRLQKNGLSLDDAGCLESPKATASNHAQARGTMRRSALALAMVLSMTLAGCFGDGSETITNEVTPSIFESYERIDAQSHEVERAFITVDLRTNETTNTTWAVFDASYGGNCCEHYLATDIDGQILNIGGEYPVFSTDRGHLWDTYIPPALPDQQCRTFVPTNPGQEGLGEGSIVQATNGDIISMSWFPYVGGDLKLDKFYAILYDASESEWKWCYNRITEPFYDRSWQVEVIGPSRPPSGMENGRASWSPTSGTKRKTPVDRSAWTA